MRKRVCGEPPKRLTGHMPVSAETSPWWERVASEISSRADLVGKEVSPEELSQIIPSYPDGRRPRPRTAVRRLRPILEIVRRGPGGSLSRGSLLRIVPLPPPDPPIELPGDIDPVEADTEWLEASIEKMAGGKKLR